jgi:hypothetical protein
MKLILRMACSKSNPQRAKEARRLLRTTPVPPSSLILRIALSKSDSQRAQAARELLKAMREPTTTPGYAVPHIRPIAANGDGTAPDEDEEVP